MPTSTVTSGFPPLLLEALLLDTAMAAIISFFASASFPIGNRAWTFGVISRSFAFSGRAILVPMRVIALARTSYPAALLIASRVLAPSSSEPGSRPPSVMRMPRQSRIGLEYLSSMTTLPSIMRWRAPRSSSMRFDTGSLSTERLVPS